MKYFISYTLLLRSKRVLRPPTFISMRLSRLLQGHHDRRSDPNALVPRVGIGRDRREFCWARASARSVGLGCASVLRLALRRPALRMRRLRMRRLRRARLRCLRLRRPLLRLPRGCGWMRLRRRRVMLLRRWRRVGRRLR